MLIKQDYLVEETSRPIAQAKSVKQSNITTHYQQITPISDTKANELDQAILKAWVCCEFSFCTIENPFIIDLFKLAIPGYTLPSRTTLSSRLLDQETTVCERNFSTLKWIFGDKHTQLNLLQIESIAKISLSQLIDLTLPEFLSTNNSLFESATNRLSSYERVYNLENREYDPVQLAQQMINEEND
ncbi:34390_t:CDS:2, partial [Gigaspora margarita]